MVRSRVNTTTSSASLTCYLFALTGQPVFLLSRIPLALGCYVNTSGSLTSLVPGQSSGKAVGSPARPPVGAPGGRSTDLTRGLYVIHFDSH